MKTEIVIIPVTVRIKSESKKARREAIADVRRGLMGVGRRRDSGNTYLLQVERCGNQLVTFSDAGELHPFEMTRFKHLESIWMNAMMLNEPMPAALVDEYATLADRHANALNDKPIKLGDLRRRNRRVVRR